MDLKDLYQEVILDHNRNPRNYGPLADANQRAEGFNPLCGDRVTIEIKLDPAGCVECVHFAGRGCAISTASASMLTESLEGKSRAEALALIERFQEFVKEGGACAHDADDLGKLAVFAGVGEFPTRVKCAMLAWHAAKAALAGEASSVSTE